MSKCCAKRPDLSERQASRREAFLVYELYSAGRRHSRKRILSTWSWAHASACLSGLRKLSIAHDSAGFAGIASTAASKRADADTPNPPVGAIAVAASALNGTISEKQTTDVEGVTRTRELLGKD